MFLFMGENLFPQSCKWIAIMNNHTLMQLHKTAKLVNDTHTMYVYITSWNVALCVNSGRPSNYTSHWSLQPSLMQWNSVVLVDIIVFILMLYGWNIVVLVDIKVTERRIEKIVSFSELKNNHYHREVGNSAFIATVDSGFYG